MQSFLLGLSFIILGTIYYFDEWDYKYGFMVPKETGYCLIMLGSFILIFAFIYGCIKEYNSEKSCNIPEWRVCEGCLDVFPKGQVTLKKCPTCGGAILDLAYFVRNRPDQCHEIRQQIISWPDE